ncbi:DUF7848 domain-containing protein [Streptomyces sp. 6N106]|uniref:DUF7848 domain-containing protein n=1 Tax=Streptomyces sp. 6N106 TaxID=3457418 RepID=UPI003FD36CD5
MYCTPALGLPAVVLDVVPGRVGGRVGPPPGTEDFADGQSWVLKHCGKNPSHHTFRERITRLWRTWCHGV